MSTLKRGLFSSVLLVIESASKKLIGMVSTIILARVLVPEDFGLIAIATLMVGFLDVLTQTGTGQYLVRSDTITDKMINTAFTINMIMKGIIAILLFIAAPFIADYYEDERLTTILMVFSVIVLLGPLKNPALCRLKREQRYGKIVKFNLFGKVLAVTCAVSVALIYESYWALILGHFVTQLWALIGSYIILPYRPGFCLHNARDQWQFSIWVIPQSILGYFRTQFDTFLVSSIFGKAELGSYHTMKYFAFIPCSQIISPASSPLLAELAKIKHNRPYFSTLFNVSLFATLFVAVPISWMMNAYAYLIIDLFLGDSWVRFAELFGIFALLIPCYAIFHHANRVIVVYGETKLTAFYEVLFTVILYSTLILAVTESVFDFTIIRVGLETVLSLALLIFAALRYTSPATTAMMFVVTLPLLLGGLLGHYLGTLVPTIDNVFFQLVAKCSAFCFGYLLVVILSVWGGQHWLKEFKYLSGLAKRAGRKFARQQQA